MGNTTNDNPVMGKNSALIPDGIKNYKPTIYHKMHFFKIPFDVNKLELIDNNIWCPAKEDKQYMTQSAFDEALDEHDKKKKQLYFNNVSVNYESCDCNEGYGCSHLDWPYEIEVNDKINNITHLITIDGNDSLIFNYGKTDISINGLESFTYGDFIRFCKLCNINLESNYIL